MIQLKFLTKVLYFAVLLAVLLPAKSQTPI